jgi:hypothetical protein
MQEFMLYGEIIRCGKLKTKMRLKDEQKEPGDGYGN